MAWTGDSLSAQPTIQGGCGGEKKEEAALCMPPYVPVQNLESISNNK